MLIYSQYDELFIPLHGFNQKANKEL